MWDFASIAEIIKAYAGTGSMLVLYVLSLFYIWMKEENKVIRHLMLWGSVLVTAVFAFPPFRKVFIHFLDTETYYRILWILPMGVVIAYVGVRIIEKHRRIGLLVMTGVIILSGSLVYKSQYISKAENRYHFPQVVVDICEEILPEEVSEDSRILAVFPSELIHFIRQYSSDIRMPYGREMLVERWGNERELYELMEAPGYNVELIADKAIQNYCKYVILNISKGKSEPMENYGYELRTTIGAYEVYYDTRF